jgi:hypothetical protein
MATRHFDKASLGAIPESAMPFSLLMSGYATPLRLILAEQPERAGREPVRRDASDAEWGNIGRGVRWAFAIEGGAALAICAVWALWRLVW